MKNIAALLCAVVLTACATGPTYRAAETSEFTQANHLAVDKLVAATAVPVVKNVPLLVATMVNIDSLSQSSRFGRLISEQIATRLTQLGYSVVEMKLRNDVYIREGAGELLLSRDVRDLSKNYNAQVVVVGNYAVAAGYVYLTLKAVTVADNRVVAAVNYLLPLTENNKALLAPPK
ncbi:MAG: FlgO family outer membrane protein [Sulfuricellaceae bacterium]|nr:FlgO family outer membrane protein [Sulfuricellaceae bacterium]